MDLCTPLFGYAAVLPREPGGIHPGYQQFRQEVLTALQKVSDLAADNGIDPADSVEARFALAVFMDEQVRDSEWSGKVEWDRDPLGDYLFKEPEGGERFFEHLDRLGERQKSVKEVYLVCLAFGFRGKYALMADAEQGPRLGDLKQRLIRSINPSPLDTKDVLFPEAYEPAIPMVEQARPFSWLYVGISLGIVTVSILIYCLLYWAAGWISTSATKSLETITMFTDSELNGLQSVVMRSEEPPSC